MNKVQDIICALVRSNYIEMFKRKDYALINDFINNPNSLSSLLIAIGANEELLEMPAHREMLETILIRNN